MIDYTLLCYGLTRAQVHTLKCRFPYGYDFCVIPEGELDDLDLLQRVVKSTWCMFINPKKLRPGQLSEIITAHKFATQNAHAAILLFTAPFTAEQKEQVDTKSLHLVDLRADYDKTLHRAIKIIRTAQTVCWDGMARMRSNMLNDGWYLLDIETTGTDPLEDDVISISVSYMANYKIQSTETLYIKQARPITEEIEKLTGITNEMLNQGVSKEQAVAYLNNLPYPAPLVVKFYDYFIPFLKVLYHSCGQKFKMPYIQLDVLTAISFGYTLFRQPYDVLPLLEQRKLERTPLNQPYLEKLYDLTLAIFENLQERYAVRAAGDFHKLYYAVIECGE